MLECPTKRSPDVVVLAFETLEPGILLRRAKVPFTVLDPVEYSLSMLTAPRVPLAALAEELACVGVHRVEHLEARLACRVELPYQTVIYECGEAVDELVCGNPEGFEKRLREVETEAIGKHP
jgi:hypothetical protein